MISAANLATLMTNTMDMNTRTMGSGQGATMNAAQVDATAKDFESMFIGQMLEQMFGDSVGSEAFGDKDTADIYKGMMTDVYGKELSKAGGIGIADYVKKELLKLQEK